ncbi:tuberin-like isoform X2 [Branchiostoma lanceolatum]|uniref:tuberin-like isoform X2 n=1 Tax=Branchiostoma lanceolatum TaxID=7740 RepID=UPI003453D5E7
MAKQGGKESTTLKDKVKQLFRPKPSRVVTSGIHGKDTREEITCTPELLKEIGPASPLTNRLKALREFGDVVASRLLEDNAVEALWLNISDLLDPQASAEARHIALRFVQSLILGQYDRLGIMRAHFFRVVRHHQVFEDIPERLEVFKALSDNGKDITNFEEETGHFLLEWMPDAVSYGRTFEFMTLMVNVIKFNSSFLDEEIVAGLVRHTCNVCNQANSEEEIEASLRVLDAVVCYSCLPSESLYQFITTLCRTINVDKFCQTSWKLMRNLLGTHLGHSSIYTMCTILQDSHNRSDHQLLRGAVFYVGMSLWGAGRVNSLRLTPTSVLPSFLQALSSNNPIVAYEVVLIIHRLIKKYGKDLQQVTWEILTDILEALLKYIQTSPGASESLLLNFHSVLSTVEFLHENKCFNGSSERLFGIIEKFASKRPESSVLLLVSYRAQSIHPAKDSWILNLQNLMDKYFRYELRTPIRIKVLDVLSAVLSSTRHLYEENLIESVVIPQLGQIADDPDVEVRNVAVQLLMDLAQTCNTERCLDILAIIEKVISRPMDTKKPVPTTPDGAPEVKPAAVDDSQLADIQTAVHGLIELFQTKLYKLPSTHACQVYDMLIGHVQSHYQHHYTANTACQIRLEVFTCLLHLRADPLHRLGLPDKDGNYKFTAYITCDMKDPGSGRSSRATSPPTSLKAKSPTPGSALKMSSLPFCKAVSAILTCLGNETEWEVLKLVLRKLTEALQNKALILSGHVSSVEELCSKLCTMVGQRSILEKLQHTPKEFPRSEFQSHMYPVLTALATYHAHLDQARQRELVRCLESGLVSKCAQQCVCALTVCSLEMRDVMMRMLPSVLLRLSQISATVAMAIPVLEFLSGLIRLPHLYANFVEEQYMSIFAIALPYTNPFKFSQYIVAMAHHVIAMWFIRCRLPFRRSFVQYITKGLKSNVPLEDRSASSPSSHHSPVSSTQDQFRTRSASFTERPRSFRPSPKSKFELLQLERSFTWRETRQSGTDHGPIVDERQETLLKVHTELLETCLDMMARYTFSTCSTIPKRSPVAEFLLAGGQTMTWLLSNQLITVTTSGGGLRMRKNGVCEKCASLLNLEEDKPPVVEAKSPVTTEEYVEAEFRERSDSASKGTQEAPGKLETLTTSPSIPPADSKRERKRSKSGGRYLSSAPTPMSLLKEEFQLFSQGLTEKTQMEAEEKATIQEDSGGEEREEVLEAEEREVEARMDTPEEAPGVTAGYVGRRAEILPDIPKDQPSPAMNPKNKSSPTKLVSRYECNCWCQGWAEILIRRPTGNTAWMMRIQNARLVQPDQDFPLADIATLLLGQKEEEYTAASRYQRSDSAPPSMGVKHDRASKPVHETVSEVFYVDAGEIDEEIHEEDKGLFHIGSLEDVSSTEPTGFEKPILGTSPVETMEVVEPLKVEDESENQEEVVVSKSPLSPIRKTNSSPQLTGEWAVYQDKEEEKMEELDNVFESKDDDDERKRKNAVTVPEKDDPSQAVKHVPQAAIGSKHSEGKESDGGVSSVSLKRVDSKERQGGQVERKESIEKQGRAVDRRESTEKQGRGVERRESTEKQGRPVERKDSKEKQKSAERTNSKGRQSGGWAGSRIMEDVKETGPPPSMETPTTPQNSPPMMRRPRAQTVSVMTPGVIRREEFLERKRRMQPPVKEGTGSGVSPSFVFLQLFHSAAFGSVNEKPILLPKSEAVGRAVKNLDRIPPYETHKCGVLYVGPGQTTDEKAILCNEFGSLRYVEFLSGLGHLIHLKDCNPDEIFLGGLDCNGNDGKFTYSWQDDAMQMIFHVATLMPYRETDRNCQSKKLHIGNDFVTIVYNDNTEDYKPETIKGQFNFVNIVIMPLDNSSNLVTIKAKKEVETMVGDASSKIISDDNLALTVRQMALHANLASMIHRSKNSPEGVYASKWLERLRQIKRIRTKVTQELEVQSPPSRTTSPSSPRSLLSDFTGFV